jgi:GH25 family lysozyme M1 (1,4-beta-N-acetylmuramidase)
LGADVSDNQGSINWTAVASSGIQFSYVKLSEGENSSYSTAAAQLNGATNAGLTTGGYHFARPNYSPQANAAAFAEQLLALNAIEGHLPPCLDLEVGTGYLGDWASAFVTELRRLTGCTRVMVYSSLSFFKTQITESWMDDDVLLWLAHIGVPAGQVGYSSPRLAMHQYSFTGQVPGVSGNVDFDVALMPLDQLTGDDVTPEQAQQLADIHAALPLLQWFYGQFAGLGADGYPAPFPDVPGWPTLPGGTDQELSLLDFLRQSNVQVNALAGAVQELTAAHAVLLKRSAAPPTQMSRSDINSIAASVASLLEAHAVKQKSPAKEIE